MPKIEDLQLENDSQPRQGWEEAFIKAESLTDHYVLMSDLTDNFDVKEWA